MARHIRKKSQPPPRDEREEEREEMWGYEHEEMRENVEEEELSPIHDTANDLDDDLDEYSEHVEGAHVNEEPLVRDAVEPALNTVTTSFGAKRRSSDSTNTETRLKRRKAVPPSSLEDSAEHLACAGLKSRKDGLLAEILASWGVTALDAISDTMRKHFRYPDDPATWDERFLKGLRDIGTVHVAGGARDNHHTLVNKLHEAYIKRTSIPAELHTPSTHDTEVVVRMLRQEQGEVPSSTAVPESKGANGMETGATAQAGETGLQVYTSDPSPASSRLAGDSLQAGANPRGGGTSRHMSSIRREDDPPPSNSHPRGGGGPVAEIEPPVLHEAARSAATGGRRHDGTSAHQTTRLVRLDLDRRRLQLQIAASEIEREQSDLEMDILIAQRDHNQLPTPQSEANLEIAKKRLEGKKLEAETIKLRARSVELDWEINEIERRSQG